MPACPFCRIVAGELDANRLYEDELTVAFLDENPAARGHLLVVPRAHLEHLFADDESVPAAVFRTVHRLAMALDRVLAPDGISLFYTSAELVGSVTHAHVHVVPRYEGDPIHLALERRSLDADADELAARIRRNVRVVGDSAGPT
ncbi:MAG: HIT family protein [Halobacteriales archaeon]